jgi:hypothetical protein
MKSPSAVRRSARCAQRKAPPTSSGATGRPKHEAVGEKLEGRIFDDDHLTVDDELGQAAARHHQDERRNDRLHAEPGHEQAVGRTSDHARPERSGQRQRERVPALQQHGAHRTGDGHHRADRKVHAAGGDDQRHAERDQHRARPLRQDVDRHTVEVTIKQRDLQEAGIVHGIQQHEGGEPEQRPEDGRFGLSFHVSPPSNA